MKIHSLLPLGITLASALFAAGCASHGAFDTTFPLNRERDLKAVLARVASAPKPAQTPVVVGVSDNPRGVFAYDLSAQRLLFSTPTDVRGVPVAAGPFMVAPEGERLRIRELSSGRVVHDVDAQGLNFVGADSDGSLTAVVLSSGGSYGARATLLILQGETVSARLSVERALGAPAVAGGLVFVPHSRVHLSAISPEGKEQLRLTVRDDVASEALSDADQVYFGLAGFYRLDQDTPKGAKAGAHYFAPNVAERRKLPGAPAFLRDTSEPPPPVDSAIHRIKLSFWPHSQGDQVGVADDTLYLSFYRMIFALGQSLDSARWVRATASDVVGSQAHPGGVVAVEESGRVHAFDLAGASVYEADMGVRPIVANVRAAGLASSGSGDALPSLVDQLNAAILHEDTRLVPAGELALRLMAKLNDAEVTGSLISICGQQEAPRRLRESACRELSSREQGSDAVLVALAKRSDYLAGTNAPPLAPLAKAAASAGDHGAAPLLLDHLEDPATDSDDLPAIVQALAKTGDAGSVARLVRFVRLYHADAYDPSLSAALVAALPTLAALDPKASTDLCEALLKDANTDAMLRAAAEKQLAAEQAQKASSEAAEASADAAPQAAHPAHLTAEHLAHAIAPVRAQVSECLRKDPSHPLEARLTVVVDGTGKVISVQTLPSGVNACVEPLVRGVTLPANAQGKRETLHYSISH